MYVIIQMKAIELYCYGVIREFKRLRRRRRGRRVVKNEFIFNKRNSRLLRSAWYPNGSENVFKLNIQIRRSFPNGKTKNQPSSSTFRRQRKNGSFHVVVLQRTAKKCTKIYNARAQPLFYSLNLLFGALHVAVVVVVCLSSLLFICGRRAFQLQSFETKPKCAILSVLFIILTKMKWGVTV